MRATFGYGQGVFVDNASDQQVAQDEGSRTNLGTTESLYNDWLNPNNGNANSGWRGPFYIPPAAYLQLDNGGFTITRNSQAPTLSERTWKQMDGTDTGTSSIRYRIGPNAFGVPYIVNFRSLWSEHQRHPAFIGLREGTALQWRGLLRRQRPRPRQ